jgi:Cys-tRNA(Pro)/Cys-tRNA(Cys) deacylase
MIEETALNEATVFVNGGQRGLQIQTDPDAVVKATDATVCALTA